MHFRIGTRGSLLALAQTNIFIEEFAKTVDFTYEIVKIKTTGDKILDKPLYEIGGKALFIKELEEALLNKEIDIAVHSLKDIPGILDERFTLGCYLERYYPLDCLVSRKAKNILELARGAKIGSTSPRRVAFLKLIRPDLQIFPLRGNINTRVEKLHAGEFDAIILAKAGLRRINLYDEKYCTPIPVSDMIPAVGQGVITTQILSDSLELARLLNSLSNLPTKTAVTIERDFLAELNASCRTPVAGFVENDGAVLKGSFMLANDDMSQMKIYSAEAFYAEGMSGKEIAKTIRGSLK